MGHKAVERLEAQHLVAPAGPAGGQVARKQLRAARQWAMSIWYLSSVDSTAGAACRASAQANRLERLVAGVAAAGSPRARR